jgi:hypothetical protein
MIDVSRGFGSDDSVDTDCVDDIMLHVEKQPFNKTQQARC